MKNNLTAVIMRKAKNAFSSGDLVCAEKLCRQLLTQYSSYSDAWNLLGNIVIVSAPLEAFEYFRTAIKFSPTNSSFRHDLAKFLLENGDIAEALPQALEAFGIEPANSEYCFTLSSVIELMGDRGSAISLYKHGLSLTESTSSLLAGFGGMLLRDEQVDQALLVLRRAVDFQPVSPDAYYLHAKCCNFHGFFHEALISINIVVELLKYESLIYCEGALAMIGLNDKVNAIIWIEKALSFDPICSQALKIKAYLISAQGLSV